MESDLGKLFIGGISWDTNEDRLREYFLNYGDVVEAVIMRDRVTGRARGFGFVVFADPAVAERVLMEKHSIDGRVVEAKKAVPRDDQHVVNRSIGSAHGSPGPAHTKKIFVGGLASTVTEGDFKKYFDQFGTITDVVVMYDHNTQRPRGFGFITYDSEDAVDKVLQNTFHELNGKMVEVKKAVPKELSPGPTARSPVGGYTYGLNRVNSFLNGYAQGHNFSLSGGLSPRVDSRFGSISNVRNGYTPLGHVGLGMGMNFEPRLSVNFTGTGNYNNVIGFGRTLSPFYNGSPTRYGSPIGYVSGNGGSGPMISSNARNIWGNGSLNYTMNSSSSGNGSLGGFDGTTLNWGSSTSSILAERAQRGSAFGNGTLGFGSGENLGLEDDIYDRKQKTGDLPSMAASGLYEGAYADLYGSNSIYSDPTWVAGSEDLDDSGQLGYDLSRAGSNVTSKSPAGYASGYSVNSRQTDRGIAA